MKNLLSLLLLTISSLSFSQSLQNTEWEVYFEGDYELNIRFGVDTLYLVEGADVIPFSNITSTSDTFRIKDLINADGCFDIVGDVWGSYLYKIENDTLSFELIEDSCGIRVETFVGADFVKAIDTATEDIDAFGNVNLFPNPLGDGILNIESREKLDLITVYDAYGKLLVSSPHATNIDLSRFSSGMFLVELRKGDKSTIKKIIK